LNHQNITRQQIYHNEPLWDNAGVPSIIGNKKVYEYDLLPPLLQVFSKFFWISRKIFPKKYLTTAIFISKAVSGTSKNSIFVYFGGTKDSLSMFVFVIRLNLKQLDNHQFSSKAER
jgi:hypothetical protein